MATLCALTACWLVLHPRIELADGRAVMSINGQMVDVTGALEDAWSRVVNACGRVRDLSGDPNIGGAVMAAIRAYSVPDSLSARIVRIQGVSEWLLVEAVFDAVPPVLAVMRSDAESRVLTIEALWSGSTHPWRTAPFAARFLRERAPGVPEALLGCMRPVSDKF